MKKKNLPSEVDLRPRFQRQLRSAPEKIRNIVAKGQGRQNCCVAFSSMNDHILQGTWGNGSVRFLHCICKMLDEMSSSLGTTMLTGIRAEKGWWTCEEDLWVSNVDLSRSEFEDWRSIPLEAFEDAKRKRIRKNKAFFNSRVSMIINPGRQRYRLITNAEKQLFEKDKQIDILLVKDSDFDTVAWAQVRAYVDQRKVVLEDLFVKPEVRRMGIGSELLRQIEYLACFDKVFREVSEEITVPIPTVDIWLPMRNQTVKAFYAKNGYKWNNTKIVPGREYSIFAASKKLACAQIPKESNSITTVVRAWLIRHLRLLRHREPNEGPCAVQIRVLNSDFMDAWVSVNRP